MSSNGIDEASLEIRDLFREFGVTDSGYDRPSSRLIWDVFVREFEDRAGREITAVSSAELQYVEQAVLWTNTYFEQLEAVYYSGYFGTAVGEQLDQVLSRHGFRRREERQAEGEVTFYASGDEASEDITIDAGTRVATGRSREDDTIYFETTETVTLREGSSEVTEVPIVGVDPVTTTLDLSDSQTGSATNVEAEAIDRMVDSVSGVSSVENPLPTGVSGTRSDGTTFSFESGRDKETDHEFRRRYLNTLGIGGRATVDALEAAILSAGSEDDVRDVEIEEDLPIREVSDDGSGEAGFIGRQVEPIVAFDPLSETDPNPEIVSQAILETRAAGIRSVGPESETAELEDGTEYDSGLGFREAEWINVHVSLELDVTREWNSRKANQIRENIVKRIGGEINGEYHDGLGIGEDVYYSRLLGDALRHDIGSWIQHIDLEIGRDPEYMREENVWIEYDEIPIVDPDDIDITVNRRSG
jgi:hypothetical protein